MPQSSHSNNSPHQHPFRPNLQPTQSRPMYNNRRDGTYGQQPKQHKYDPNQDYMTMNEPKGPELKYHERKKLQNNSDQHEYPPNNFQDYQQDSWQPHNIPNSRMDKPQVDPFEAQMKKYQRTYPETKIFPNIPQPPSKSNSPPIPEEVIPEDELNEFFKHNNERMSQFTSDRERYGNFYDISKERREQDKKDEQKAAASHAESEAKKKKKKKKAPTAEQVDTNARKYIKLFMLKIHPDFFHNDPAKKAHIAYMNSLQALNSFLDALKQMRDPTKHIPKDRVPLPFALSFHLKDSDKSISTTFHLPKVPVEGVSHVFSDLLRQRAYEGIADMISKAKIKIEEEDKWVIKNAAEQEKRDFAFSKLPKHWRPIGWSPTDQDYGVIEILLESCRYPDILNEILNIFDYANIY